jgi:hypothetical protein
MVEDGWESWFLGHARQSVMLFINPSTQSVAVCLALRRAFLRYQMGPLAINGAFITEQFRLAQSITYPVRAGQLKERCQKLGREGIPC